MMGRSDRHGHPPHAPWRRPTGQTSRPEPPANGPHRNRSGCSEKQCHSTSRSPRERRSEDQTTDAMGTAVLETRFDQASCLNPIQATSTRGVCACIRRVAGCATPTGSAGHAGATANLKLTFHLDHSVGADQALLRTGSRSLQR
jgi:hypothetical protein